MDEARFYNPGQYNRLIIFLAVVILVFYILVTIYCSLALFYFPDPKTGKSDFVAKDVIDCNQQAEPSQNLQNPQGVAQNVQGAAQPTQPAQKSVQNGTKLKFGSNPYRKGK